MNAYAVTDVGACRKVNEDYVFCTRRNVGKLPNLFVLADGMGGHKAGDTASKYTVQILTEAVKNSIEENPISIINESIKYANKRLLEYAATSPEFTGMGTTLVVATIVDGSLYVANIGDSRLYIKSDDLRQITRDHSLVEEMVSNGTIDRKDARNHEKKNIITRAVGGSEDVMADFFEVEVRPGDIVLMCSDGLSNMVEDKEIASLLDSNEDIVVTAGQLVDKANCYGGKDNISIILIEP